jgi:hypothetical protein
MYTVMGILTGIAAITATQVALPCYFYDESTDIG